MPASTSEEKGQGLPPHNVGEYFGGEGTGPSPHNVGVYIMPMAEEETPEQDELNVTRPETGARGNCRERSSSLSEIMQIVTSAVRVLWFMWYWDGEPIGTSGEEVREAALSGAR